MMESYGGMRGMRPVNEDNLSTGSGSQPDSETNLRPASPGSESLPLRFANGGGRFVTVKRQKAVITTLAFTALVIVSTVFGTLYFNTENGNELVKKSTLSSDHEIFVRDLEDDDHVHNEMLGDMPGPDPDSTPQSTNRSTNSKKSKKKNRVQHGPRPLPFNAQEKDAFSLLYQMKLVHGSHQSFIKYLHCEDSDLDGKKLFKGWKAILPVNLTAAGITEDHQKIFQGYGTKRNEARRRAAQLALTTLYPGKLEYPGEDDLSEIDTYCEQEKTEAQAQQIPESSNANSTTVTSKPVLPS